MIKSEVKIAVLEQLEFIPSWDECKNLSAEDIRKTVMQKLKFEPIRNWLKQSYQNKLNFTIEEIGERWFQFILFWILEREEDGAHFFSNEQILEDNYKRSKNTAGDKWFELSREWGCMNIQSLKLERFLEFAKVPI